MELRGSKKINLAIVSPNKHSYSETFIEVQKEYLPHNIFLYYDGIPPRRVGDGVSLQPRLLQTAWAKIVRTHSNLLVNNIQKSFQKNKIDIVLAQFGPTGAALAKICANLNLPLVVHFHGADAYVHRYIDPVGPYQELFKVAAGIIVVSDDMRRQLLRLGASESLLSQTCYGPRNEFFNLKPIYEGKHLLAVGRFVDKKAPYFTILAFSQVLKKHRDAQLTMVGDGPLLGVAKNLVKYLGIADSVTFTGPLAHVEVCKLMEKSLCFVQHSITAEDGDKEGSPVAIIEAAAAGLPVVATKHAGINFTVVHGKSGFLVDEGDVDGMANFINQICSSSSLARTLGENAREHIRNNATLEMYINDVNSVLMDVYNRSY